MTTLSQTDLKTFFSDYVSHEARKNLLLEINERGVQAQDIANFVHILLPDDFPEMKGAIDICGTGGSGLKRINTSTISAFILADMGVKIAKHGNRASSGRFGSFDLLEKLGVDIDLDAQGLKKTYEQENLAFIFAQKFFPAMHYFAPVRQEIGVPTVFNLLGPLLNPAQPAKQVIGTNSIKNTRLIAEASHLIGREHVLVFTADNHLDEVSLSGTTHCVEMKNGNLSEFKIIPADFGLEAVGFDEIAGGDAQKNTQIALDILSGECQTAHRDLVLINSASVLLFMGQVGNLKEGFKKAKEAIDSGKALAKLTKMQK